MHHIAAYTSTQYSVVIFIIWTGDEGENHGISDSELSWHRWDSPILKSRFPLHLHLHLLLLFIFYFLALLWHMVWNRFPLPLYLFQPLRMWEPTICISVEGWSLYRSIVQEPMIFWGCDDCPKIWHLWCQIVLWRGHLEGLWEIGSVFKAFLSHGNCCCNYRQSSAFRCLMNLSLIYYWFLSFSYF